MHGKKKAAPAPAPGSPEWLRKILREGDIQAWRDWKAQNHGA